MKDIKNIRLKNYDYSSNGFYFVTVCTRQRKSILNDDSLVTIVKKGLESLGETEGVELDYHVIMPDHVHFIIVLNDCQLKLGEILRRFKAKARKEAGIKLWQPNYYEHVIRSERALSKIREYVVNNPIVAEIDFEQFYDEV